MKNLITLAVSYSLALRSFQCLNADAVTELLVEIMKSYLNMMVLFFDLSCSYYFDHLKATNIQIHGLFI